MAYEAVEEVVAVAKQEHLSVSHCWVEAFEHEMVAFAEVVACEAVVVGKAVVAER